MSLDSHKHNKRLINKFRAALYDCDASQLKDQLHELFAPACVIRVARHISGFRNWHQIPYLKAMPDRKPLLEQGVLFGEGDYVGFTAWPGLQVTLRLNWEQ